MTADDRARRDELSAAIAATIRGLLPDQRELILDQQVASNPGLDGIHLDDLLEMLEDHDAYLGARESAWDRYGEPLAERYGRAKVAIAMIATVMLACGRLPEAVVRGILDRGEHEPLDTLPIAEDIGHALQGDAEATRRLVRTDAPRLLGEVQRLRTMLGQEPPEQ